MKANHTFGVLFILVSALILFSPAQYSVCAAFEDVAEEPSSEQSPSEVDSSDSQPVDQEPSVEAADNTENGNNSESEESSGLDDMSSAPSGGFQIDASETNLPSSTPDFSILTKSLIAKGRNSAILEAKVSGLFVIRAASGQGTAIRIIDRVFGTVMESGKPGKRDGECILFLDKGSYKIEMMSHNQGSGALKLLVRNCSEQNGSIPVAFNPEQTIMTDLSPFQQRSYWFSIRTNTRVKIIARGRNIADLRLWHEGQWLMDMEPDKKDDTGADSDQPIRSFAFNTELKPGFYRVTAYSVKKCEWAKKSSLDPFIISYGIRTIPGDSMLIDTVSSVGENLYLASDPGIQNLTAYLSGPFGSTMDIFGGSAQGSLLNTDGMSRGDFDPRARFPEAQISANSSEGQTILIHVRGKPGTRFKLQTIKNEENLYPNHNGKYWISALPSGSLSDRIGQSGIVAEYVPRTSVDDHWQIAAKDLPLIGDGQNFEDKFTCDTATSVFFETSQNGSYKFEISGDITGTITVRRYFVNGDVKLQFIRGKGSLSLLKGIYLAEITPSRAGVATLKISAGEFFPSKKTPYKRSHFQIPSVDLQKSLNGDIYYTIALNNRGGSSAYSRIVRSLPLDLRMSLPIILDPGEEVTSAFTCIDKNILDVTLLTNLDISISIDGQAVAKKSFVSTGEHSFTIINNSTEIAYITLALRSQEDEGGPIHILPTDTSYISKLAVLKTGSPTYFDLDRKSGQIFNVDIPTEGIYTIKTTGRLKTKITIRSALRPSLLTEEMNVDGENTILLAYLKKGTYQAVVETLGETTGHLGVRLDNISIRSGGNFLVGTEKKCALKFGEAMQWTVPISTNAEYTVNSYSIDGTAFPFRLEGPDGWLIDGVPEQYQYNGSLIPGNHAILGLPGKYENRRTISLSRNSKSIQATGKGPIPILLNKRYKNEWNEQLKNGIRMHDIYSFSIPADIDNARISVTGKMAGDLYRIDAKGDREQVYSVDGYEGYDGERGFDISLNKGNYIWSVYLPSPDNGIEYSTSINTSVLVDGVPLQLKNIGQNESGLVKVSLGNSGPVMIGSRGSADLSARLFNSNMREIAQSDDTSADWNFLIARYLPKGKYFLKMELIEAPKTVRSEDAENWQSDYVNNMPFSRNMYLERPMMYFFNCNETHYQISIRSPVEVEVVVKNRNIGKKIFSMSGSSMDIPVNDPSPGTLVLFVRTLGQVDAGTTYDISVEPLGSDFPESDYRVDMSKQNSQKAQQQKDGSSPELEVFLQSMGTVLESIPKEGLKKTVKLESQYRELHFPTMGGAYSIQVDSGSESSISILSVASGRTDEIASSTGTRHKLTVFLQGSNKCLLGILPLSKENDNLIISIRPLPPITEIGLNQVLTFCSDTALRSGSPVRINGVGPSSFYIETDPSNLDSLFQTGTSRAANEPTVLFPYTGEPISLVDGKIYIKADIDSKASIKWKLRPATISENKPLLSSLQRTSPLFYSVPARPGTLQIMHVNSANIQPLCAVVDRTANTPIMLVDRVPISSSLSYKNNNSVAAVFGTGSPVTFAVWNGDKHLVESSAVATYISINLPGPMTANAPLQRTLDKGTAESWNLPAGNKRIRVTLGKDVIAVFWNRSQNISKILSSSESDESFEITSSADGVTFASIAKRTPPYSCSFWMDTSAKTLSPWILMEEISLSPAFSDLVIPSDPGQNRRVLNFHGTFTYSIIDGKGFLTRGNVFASKETSVLIGPERQLLRIQADPGFNKIWTSIPGREALYRWGFEKTQSTVLSTASVLSGSIDPGYWQVPSSNRMVILESSKPFIAARFNGSGCRETLEKTENTPLFFLSGPSREIFGIRKIEGPISSKLDERSAQKDGILISWTSVLKYSDKISELLIQPGQSLAYSFVLKEKEDMAVGFSANSDFLSSTLLDEKFNVLGTGHSIFKSLEKGIYYLIIRNTGGASRLKPLVMKSTDVDKILEEKAAKEFLENNGYLKGDSK